MRLKNILSLGLLILFVMMMSACQSSESDDIDDEDPQDIIEDDNSTEKPQGAEEITIEGIGTFWYEPNKVQTLRNDVFKEGYFSIFAILVYLAEQNHFEMNYSFDESMNTYIIHDINGISDWWYTAHYEGGWREVSVYRMDHFPFKEEMTIRLYQESETRINSIYTSYKDEVNRFQKNGGKIIIPEVIIDGIDSSYIFYNVEITAHYLRDEMFQDGVITAMDVIMSLGDLGEITYELKWYDSIGSVEIVRSYWVHAINDDVQVGTSGFVYEAGAWAFYHFQGNHIHIPSDTRVINSPEYVRFFWLGGFEIN